MSKIHKECNKTAKVMRHAEKKARKYGEDLMYWMRMADPQPQECETAADWLRYIADSNEDQPTTDRFIEGNFQGLKKWTVKASDAYDAWEKAVNACWEYEDAKGKTNKKRKAS